MHKNSQVTFSPEEVRATLHRLEQAIRDHGAWLMQWHRSIICALPMDLDHLAMDAHRRCAFGQWFYQEGGALMEPFGVTMPMETLHRAMHDRARELSQEVLAGQNLSTTDYDNFLSLRSDFRTLLGSVEHQLQDLLINTDPLTRVYNRQQMMPLLLQEQERAAEKGEQCVLSLVDLDHFKIINDTYGHLVGDRVLQHVAQLLAGHLRPADLVFRYGGEEFLLCLPDINIQHAIRVLNRLREQLAEERIEIGEGRTLQVTGTFGVTLMEKALPMEKIVARADQALYSAKEKGRNLVVAWG